MWFLDVALLSGIGIGSDSQSVSVNCKVGIIKQLHLKTVNIGNKGYAAAGYGIGFVFQRLWLRVIGTIGILGFCIVFHGIYNLLVTAGGTWQRCGYLFPVICIMLVYIIRLLRNHLQRNP